MHPEREKLPTSEFWWQKIRHSFLQNVDDQDEDEDDDQRQEADVDAQVVGLVDEGEAHDVGGKDDEHEDQVEDCEPPVKWKTFVSRWLVWVLRTHWWYFHNQNIETHCTPFDGKKLLFLREGSKSSESTKRIM